MRLFYTRSNIVPLTSLLMFVILQTATATAQSVVHRKPSLRARQAPARATYTNPVFNEDFPDPTVIRASNGYYYAYATQTIIDKRTINIQVARSLDMIHWVRAAVDALPVKPAWSNATQKFWAPDVHERGKTFYMYFSAEPNTREGLCLGVATASAPAGPFVDSGQPLKCGEGFVNIDPMAFDDPKTGKHLLYWGSGFQPLKVQELSPDRLSFAPGSQPVELIRPIPGTSYQRLVEGSWVIERGGTYYIFYSGDNCCGDKAHYAVMVARSKSPFGPFQTYAEATGKTESAILERSDRWIAPGHNSVVTDSTGQDWIFYHAIDAGNRLMPKIEGDRDVRRIMLMDRIVYRNGWPQIETGKPSTTPQRAPIVRQRTSHRKTIYSQNATR